MLRAQRLVLGEAARALGTLNFAKVSSGMNRFDSASSCETSGIRSNQYLRMPVGQQRWSLIGNER